MITKQFKEGLKTVVLNYGTHMHILQADIKKLDNYATTELAKAANIWRIKQIITDKTNSPSVTEEMFPINSDGKVESEFVFSFDDLSTLTFK